MSEPKHSLSTAGMTLQDASSSAVAEQKVEIPPEIEIFATMVTLGEYIALTKKSTSSLPSASLSYGVKNSATVTYRICDSGTKELQKGAVFSIGPSGETKQTKLTPNAESLSTGKKLQVWGDIYGYFSLSMHEPAKSILLRGREEHLGPISPVKCRVYRYYITIGVLTYLVEEMIRNAKSEDVKAIRTMINNKALFDAKVKGLLNFRNGGIWDLKPPIAAVWGEDNRLGDTGAEYIAYNSDVWSNIHFGFIGRHCGWSLDDLLKWADYYSQGTTASPDANSDKESTAFGFGLAGGTGDPTEADILAELDRHPLWRDGQPGPDKST